MNFARLAAAARKLTMDCHIRHEERVAAPTHTYRASGNVLLEKPLGAALHGFPEGEDETGANNRLEEIAAELKAPGRHPYIIHPAPEKPPLGALGYVAAARELVDRITADNLRINETVPASGSGHVHGGLLFGSRTLGRGITITGIRARRDAEAQRPRLMNCCRGIAALLGVALPVGGRYIRLDDRYPAPGYGRLNRPTIEAIGTAARHEGLIPDPVYTGKAMAGFPRRARDDADGNRTLLFIPDGGTPAVFAYGEALNAAMIHE